MKKNLLHEIMSLAWQLVKRNGFSMSEAMKCAWANMKLKAAMKQRIVKFYFKKVDGSVREAYGTLKENLIPATSGESRKKNDTVQVYFDTERQEYRCFKKANLLNIAACLCQRPCTPCITSPQERMSASSSSGTT